MEKGATFCLKTPSHCCESLVAFSERFLYIMTFQGESWIVPFSEVVTLTPNQIIFYQNKQKWQLMRRKK